MNELDDVFEREMGLTHLEFFRTLPSAVGEQEYTIDGSTITISLKVGQLIITLAPESVRRIASARIPKTEVHFSFENVSAEEKLSFLSYFDKRFQRGGG